MVDPTKLRCPLCNGSVARHGNWETLALAMVKSGDIHGEHVVKKDHAIPADTKDPFWQERNQFILWYDGFTVDDVHPGSACWQMGNHLKGRHVKGMPMPHDCAKVTEAFGEYAMHQLGRM